MSSKHSKNICKSFFATCVSYKRINNNAQYFCTFVESKFNLIVKHISYFKNKLVLGRLFVLNHQEQLCSSPGVALLVSAVAQYTIVALRLPIEPTLFLLLRDFTGFQSLEALSDIHNTRKHLAATPYRECNVANHV